MTALKADGRLVAVDPEEVAIGTIIIVQPGEKIPIDGVVMQGQSSLDTAALTGESLPRDVGEGDEVVSGCINMTGLLKVKTTKAFGDSTVSKILDLVENAGARKSRQEKFIARKCMRIVRQNIVFALAVKFVCLVLGALGMTNLWIAIFADVGVMVLAVLNAIRAMMVKK